LVFATRYPLNYWLNELEWFLSYWVSPRASIWLIKTAKTLAFLNWRDFVTPDDIKDVAWDVLRHRIGLSFEALWENISTDFIIQTLLSSIIVP
jgi:MoxR-like ATPase